MMKLVHAMENGSVAGMLVDQNIKARNGGAFVDMFGLPVPVSRFPGTMVLKKNAYIGVGSCIRLPNGHFKATMDPLPKPASEYTSEEEVIQDIMKMTENLIRMAPENGQAFVLFQTCKGFRQGLSYAEVAAHQKSGAGRGGRY